MDETDDMEPEFDGSASEEEPSEGEFEEFGPARGPARAQHGAQHGAPESPQTWRKILEETKGARSGALTCHVCEKLTQTRPIFKDRTAVMQHAASITSSLRAAHRAYHQALLTEGCHGQEEKAGNSKPSKRAKLSQPLDVASPKIVWPPIVLVRNARTDKVGNVWNGLTKSQVKGVFEEQKPRLQDVRVGWMKDTGHTGTVRLVFKATSEGYVQARELDDRYRQAKRGRADWATARRRQEADARANQVLEADNSPRLFCHLATVSDMDEIERGRANWAPISSEDLRKKMESQQQEALSKGLQYATASREAEKLKHDNEVLQAERERHKEWMSTEMDKIRLRNQHADAKFARAQRYIETLEGRLEKREGQENERYARMQSYYLENLGKLEAQFNERHKALLTRYNQDLAACRQEEQDKVRQLQAKTWQLQGGEKSQNLGNEEDDDPGSICTICYEKWGEQRRPTLIRVPGDPHNFCRHIYCGPCLEKEFQLQAKQMKKRKSSRATYTCPSKCDLGREPPVLEHLCLE